MSKFIRGSGVLPPYAPDATVFLPEPRFDVLVVDPPWSYGRATPERKRDIGRPPYPTIGQDGGEINRRTGAGIQAIIDTTPIPDWAEANAHLYLWTTNPKLPFAFKVMEEWDLPTRQP